ncbi:hypothetical protein [Streptomyces sp. NPDC002133]|uniref:hypothetical protein n=1 Tax=Streptomyces sp. NPDC002133 TaxID=3154409 RepID=UPI0033251633
MTSCVEQSSAPRRRPSAAALPGRSPTRPVGRSYCAYGFGYFTYFAEALRERAGIRDPVGTVSHGHPALRAGCPAAGGRGGEAGPVAVVQPAARAIPRARAPSLPGMVVARREEVEREVMPST